jgi:hypothetical protein
MANRPKFPTGHSLLKLSFISLTLFTTLNCKLAPINLDNPSQPQNPRPNAPETTINDHFQYPKNSKNAPETDTQNFQQTFPMLLLLINYIPIIFLTLWWAHDRYIKTGVKIVHIDR